MEYIRGLRADPTHDPNTVHCLYGNDADLIMLGAPRSWARARCVLALTRSLPHARPAPRAALASHEARFLVLREHQEMGRKRRAPYAARPPPRPFSAACLTPNTPPNSGSRPRGAGASELAASATSANTRVAAKRKPFLFVDIPALRQYLASEFAARRFWPAPRGEAEFAWDLERIVDDFVFMCFLVGNDFLPHLPSLSIREGALELLIELYRRRRAGLGDYLTHNGGV